MKYLIILLAFFTVTSYADDLKHLEEIEQAKDKVVYGKPLKAEDLKGKVILFKYWGYN